MKSQKYNQGPLKELKVMIDKDVVESFEKMVPNSGRTIEDLIVIALLRYRASHGDYLGNKPAMGPEDEI